MSNSPPDHDSSSKKKADESPKQQRLGLPELSQIAASSPMNAQRSIFASHK